MNIGAERKETVARAVGAGRFSGTTQTLIAFMRLSSGIFQDFMLLGWKCSRLYGVLNSTGTKDFLQMSQKIFIFCESILNDVF